MSTTKTPRQLAAERALSARERATGQAKKPRRVTVGIYLDDQYAVTHARAEQALETARIEQERTRPRRVAEYAAAGHDGPTALGMVADEDHDTLHPLEQAVAVALADLDGVTEWFTFESIGARRLRALARLHPPTDEQVALHRQQGGAELAWNPDTFPRALLADSCVSHPGYDWDTVFGHDDDEDDDGLPARSAWSMSDVEALVAHAVNANQAIQIAQHRPAPRFEG